MPRAPRQQVMFNAAVAEVVADLISRAAVTLWKMEQAFHVADLKIGHAPGANLSRRTQIFKRRHDAGKVGDPIWKVQEIEIEMVSPETGKARLTSARDTISACMRRPYLGDYEYAIALTGNHVADQFLSAHVAIYLRRIMSSQVRCQCAVLLPQEHRDVFLVRGAMSPARALGEWCRRGILLCALDRSELRL